MALPTSRNTTYAASSQVKSVDLNDIQDQIIADHTDLVAAESLLYGTRTVWIHGCDGQLTGPSGGFLCTPNGFTDTNNGSVNYAIKVPTGARLLDIRVRMLTTATAGTRQAVANAMPSSTGVSANLQAAVTSTVTSSLITLSPIVGNDYTIAADTVYMCQVTYIANDYVKMIGIDWDWP